MYAKKLMASRIQSFQDLGGEILAKHTELLTAFRTCAESYMASATPPQPPAAESIPYAMFLALGTYRPFGSSCPANGPVLAILRAEELNARQARSCDERKHVETRTNTRISQYNAFRHWLSDQAANNANEGVKGFYREQFGKLEEAERQLDIYYDIC